MEADPNVGQSDESEVDRDAPPAPPTGITIDGAAELLLNQDTGDPEDLFWPAVGR